MTVKQLQLATDVRASMLHLLLRSGFIRQAHCLVSTPHNPRGHNHPQLKNVLFSHTNGNARFWSFGITTQQLSIPPPLAKSVHFRSLLLTGHRISSSVIRRRWELNKKKKNCFIWLLLLFNGCYKTSGSPVTCSLPVSKIQHGRRWRKPWNTDIPKEERHVICLSSCH